MPKATLSNYLWIRKRDVEGHPSEFAPDWQFDIDFSATASGRAQRQMTEFLKEMAIISGQEFDEADFTLPSKMTVKNWQSVGDWWTFSRGDLARCRALAKKLGLEISDKRTTAAWGPELDGLQMAMEPRDYQVETIKEWAEKGALLKAPPGYGKTYVMVNSVVRHKRCMTLVLTHTDVLASQFITRFRDGSNGKLLTTCLEVEEALGKPVIGRYRGKEIWPVTVATWQSFTGPHGRARLRELKSKFGRILVDEAHAFAAPCPTSVIDEFDAVHRDGVSATYNRKDFFQKSLFNVVGPITTVGVMKEMPVRAYMIRTDSFFPEPKVPRQKQWTMLINAIARDTERNDKLLDWLSFDVREGRTIIVISERVTWCYSMQAELEARYGIPSKVVQGSLSHKKALAIRKDAEDAITSGAVQVLFATSVFKLGVDIPTLDTMYMPFPMANDLNLEQMLGRIRRLLPKKKMPVFRYFVDEGAGALYGCARKTASGCALLDKVEVVTVPKHTNADLAMARFKEAALQAHLHPEEAKEKKAIEEKKKTSTFKKVGDSTKAKMDALFDDLDQEQKLKKTFKRRLQ